MENKNKIFLTFALSLAFTMVLSYLVSFPSALFGFAPTKMAYFGYLVGWGFAFAVSVFVVMKLGLVERLVPNWGTKILTVAVSLLLLLFFVVLLLGLVFFGGDTTYSVLSVFYFFTVAYFPIKIMVVVVLLKILLSLKPTEDILQAEVVESKGRMLITVLGFAVFFQQLFPKLFALSTMMTMKLGENVELGYVKIVLFVLGWIVPLVVAYVFVKKTKIYDRITSSFAIKLLAVMTIIGVIFQVAYGWFFSTGMLMSIDSKQFGLILISGVEVASLLVNGVLAACILKILLTLKPATHLETVWV